MKAFLNFQRLEEPSSRKGASVYGALSMSREKFDQDGTSGPIGVKCAQILYV